MFYNNEGEKMSRLKEVDDEWIVRRLERWGRRDNMPFLGPDKAAVVQEEVRRRAPRCAVEVGGMCGYSGLKIAQALPAGARSPPRPRPPPPGPDVQGGHAVCVGFRSVFGNVLPARERPCRRARAVVPGYVA